MTDTYRGTYQRGATVTRNGQPLRQRQDLVNHSPCGHAWGYWGAGPHQLALDLLADYFRGLALGDRLAREYHSRMLPLVASWEWTSASIRGWEITSDDIREALTGRTR